MRKVKILIRSLVAALAVVSAAVFTAIAYADTNLAQDYFMVEGTQFNVNCQVPITVNFESAKPSQKNLFEENTQNYKANFKLLGVFPVSSANVSVIDEMSVKVLGTPFGVKIYTDGVLVVGMDAVDGKEGNINPAEESGIKLGDTILSINGQKVASNEDVYNIVSSSEGKELKVKIRREEKEKTVKIKPIFSKSAGIYRIGVWVRDSTAGIGTLTFYSPATNIVCGLGHGICDNDTEKLMSVSSGEIVKAEIVSTVKGMVGSPGELKGKLTETTIGTLVLNSETGVYSECEYNYGNNFLLNVAMKQEIKNGPAYIYTTIDGEQPQNYTCEIEVRPNHESDSTHNMIVTITDERLIDKTGGIAQGMSGSPIIQNGKLIGAVTHVFVNDAKKGYGIFAENMLETASQATEKQTKKDAS